MALRNDLTNHSLPSKHNRKPLDDDLQAATFAHADASIRAPQKSTGKKDPIVAILLRSTFTQ